MTDPGNIRQQELSPVTDLDDVCWTYSPGERPTFESDADMESYYGVWDSDETTLHRTF